MISDELQEKVREAWFASILPQYRLDEKAIRMDRQGRSVQAEAARHLSSAIILAPPPKPILDRFFARIERHVAESQKSAKYARRKEPAPRPPRERDRRRATPSLPSLPPYKNGADATESDRLDAADSAATNPSPTEPDRLVGADSAPTTSPTEPDQHGANLAPSSPQEPLRTIPVKKLSKRWHRGIMREIDAENIRHTFKHRLFTVQAFGLSLARVADDGPCSFACNTAPLGLRVSPPALNGETRSI